MSSSSFEPERTGPPPFVDPYLQSLDRMQQRQTLRPEQVAALAETVLLKRCGHAAAPVEVAFTHGAVGLLAGHTHYFDGFAVLMPLAHGTAVAVRVRDAASSCLVFEGSGEVWTFDGVATSVDQQEGPVWARAVAAVARRLVPAGTQIAVAVASTIESGCLDAYLAALVVATARALQALFALSDDLDVLLEDLHEALVECLEMPFSPAFLIAAEAGRPGTFTLVDVKTRESLPVEAPPSDELGWGLVDVGSGQLYDAAQHRERKEKADAALKGLQQRGFPHLDSLRDLEHRDLERAQKALPRRLRPIVRHLVTENRRVQKLIVAARRKDWQLFGAMLLMSHASLRDDWHHTSPEVDFVVEQVEAMSLDGMYGACVTGRGGCVLVLGLPFVVLPCLDQLRDAFAERFGRVPETVLL